MEKQTEMIQVAKTGGHTRWIAVTALFLTIGVILRLVSPSIGGISPNWLIAMYCLAILIIKPDLKQALGIGIVAGIVCAATSKAAFPYANLISEPAGAVTCALLVRLALPGKLQYLLPGVSTLISTIVSGFLFVTVTKAVMSIPIQIYLYAMLPVVFTVAAVNCVVAQVLYFPAARLFSGQPAAVPKEEQG